MIDLDHISRAIIDTLAQVAPENHRFAIVVWWDDDGGRRAGVFTNDMNRETVGSMLTNAGLIVINDQPHHYLEIDEPAGNA